MKTIADLVANHRDYCNKFRAMSGKMFPTDGEYLLDPITIEEYNRRVQSHLSMTVNRIKKLSQGK